jgi:hypothetical protein
MLVASSSLLPAGDDEQLWPELVIVAAPANSELASWMMNS